MSLTTSGMSDSLAVSMTIQISLGLAFSTSGVSRPVLRNMSLLAGVPIIMEIRLTPGLSDSLLDKSIKLTES